ncbi:hypothetical protein [Bradyrhizobium japonicum]|uniref:hypothetical protein n=1 Tax=Bradyrhizobium japonicum TaxID=375 RepID=UPI0012FD6565|nr:hypothetical protein [Bradyrhizobium japonicum]
MAVQFVCCELLTNGNTALAGSVLANNSNRNGDAPLIATVKRSAANVGSQITSGALLAVGTDGSERTTRTRCLRTSKSSRSTPIGLSHDLAIPSKQSS